MNYHPHDMKLWDAWYLAHNGEVHAFHMQLRAPDSKRDEIDEKSLGHAVSNNLIDWKELPMAVQPGEPGSGEDMMIFTGCAIEKDGVCYLYYTQRNSENDGKVQRIALATSEDFVHFEKYPGNPVIDPDPRYFCTEDKPARYGIVDCRDLLVVKDPDGNGYYGFYAARMPSEEMPEGAAIACVHSMDLINWESVGPVYVAKTNTIVEVPDVFFMDGKWYMTLLVSNDYGSRDLFDEQELTNGTIYVVSDRLTGPYHEEEDNIVIASRHFNGFTCRSVVWNDTRYLLYICSERVGQTDTGAATGGTLSTPKEYRIVGGKLRAVYSDLIEQRCTPSRVTDEALRNPLSDGYRVLYATPARWTLANGAIKGSIRTCWDRYQLDIREERFLFETDIVVDEGAAAGAVFKQNDGYSGYAVILDYNWQKLIFSTVPRMETIDARDCALVHGRKYNLKVVCTGIYYEVYLDDVLMIQAQSYLFNNGVMGLFIDRAQVQFSNLRIRGFES